ncbi:MAG: hypothetical protein VYA94_01165 [Candidatus Thermoplasmatota archaeon]|jgi:hypothetical protein|nr:hypothetical protein [Euryarchaeota archaeon]MEC9075478.1 hypothetical protein [Candidatus Thermoplasmatota archaeon]|tara:strand:- start:1863 stop:2411 length:549 start_codon:yes stop_codon:yes gene_type:complete
MCLPDSTASSFLLKSIDGNCIVFQIKAFFYMPPIRRLMPDIKGTLPEWAIRIYEAHGSPDLDDIQDVFHGPLSERSAGLRKDDLVEILIDSRALSEGSETLAKGMLVGTTRNAVEIVDEKGTFRSIARDVIVEVRLIAHMRVPYLEDREMMTFEKEDMRRRSSMLEKAEQLAEGGIDSHLWG